MDLMAAGTKHYSAELKRDAVTMVVELVVQGSTEWAAMKKTADLLGVGAAETVRQWVPKAPGAGGRLGLPRRRGRLGLLGRRFGRYG